MSASNKAFGHVMRCSILSFQHTPVEVNRFTHLLRISYSMLDNCHCCLSQTAFFPYNHAFVQEWLFIPYWKSASCKTPIVST